MGLSHQKPATHISEENKLYRVFIDGYYSTGKTTILHCVMADKSIPIRRTIYMQVETLVINNNSIELTDVGGGRSGSRPLRQLNYVDMEGIIFVIDSTDRERIDEVRDELHKILNGKHWQHKHFLILGNKQDLPNAMNADELRDKLNLNERTKNTKWHLQLTSAINNEGVQEGLQWLQNSFVEKTDPMKPIVETLNDIKRMHKYLRTRLNMSSFKILFNKCI